MNLKLFAVVALSVIVAASAHAQEATTTPEPDLPDCPSFAGESADVRTSYYLGEGLAFFTSSQLGAAEFSFTCIIEVIDEDNIAAYMNRAAVRTTQRLYEEAIADYSEALERNADLTAAYNNRGILYTALGENDDAQADFEQALVTAPDSLLALNNIAVFQVINDDLEGALATLDQILANSAVTSQLEQITRPENPLNVFDLEIDTIAARAYALRGIVYSRIALENFNAYQALVPNGDFRIADIAGSLESRFAFDLRLEDGTWWLAANYNALTGQ